MKHLVVALKVFEERMRPLGHKIGKITSVGEVVTSYEMELVDDDNYFGKSFQLNGIEFEYYNCVCPLCNYVGVLSIMDGMPDVFRIDDDRGYIAHKSGSLSNEFSVCPRLAVME